MSLAETIPRNNNSVIRYTGGGRYGKAEWAASLLSHTQPVVMFAVTGLFSPFGESFTESFSGVELHVTEQESF